MGNRLTFTDDVIIQEDQKIFDITDLISNFRDGYCHIDTYRKKHRNKAYSFIELRGNNKLQFDSTIAGKYEDDIAYVLGGNLLYLKRHIERVYSELHVVFRDIVGQNIMNFALRTRHGS
jgi:hypothetical protein